AEDGIRDRTVTGVQTCARPILHNATTSASVASATANDPNPANRALLVNTTPPPGGGAIELLIPSDGWVMYGYQWPEPSRANLVRSEERRVGKGCRGGWAWSRGE